MFCPKCGKENTDDSKFCSYCGAKIELAEPMIAPALAVEAETPAPTPEPVPKEVAEPIPEPVPVPETVAEPAPEAVIPPMPPMQSGMPMSGSPIPPMQQPMQPMQQPIPPMQPDMPMNGQQMQPIPPMQPGMPMNGQQMQPMQPVPPVGGQFIPPVPQPQMPGEEPKAPLEPGKKGNTAAIIVIVLIVLLILGALGFLGFRMVTKNAQNKAILEKVELADEYLSDRDFERAIAIYQEILDEDPDNADAITGLTNAYIRWADHMVAAGDYDGAITLLENADSRAKKARIADALADAKMAKEAYEEDLRLAEEERKRKEEAERQQEEDETKQQVTRLLQEYADNELEPNLLNTDILYTASYIWADLDYSANTYERENGEADPQRVWDYADVLPDEEEQLLTDRIAEIEARIACDVVLVTINQSVFELFGYTGEHTAEAWENYLMLTAKTFYEENSYGFNKPSGDGIILLDSWYPGEEGLYLLAYGKLSKVYTSENISTLLDTVDERIFSDPYKAYVTYIEDAFVKGLIADENAYANYGYVQDVEGVDTYDIRDYDGDGQDEMLVLVNEWDRYSGLYFSSSTWIRMYEVVGGQVVLADEFILLNNVFGGGDAEIDGVYVKESDGTVYIAADMQKAWSLLADGVYMAMGLWYYDGSMFRTLWVDNVVGSDLYGDESFAETGDNLRAYGFTATADYVDDGNYYSFDYDIVGDDMEVLFFLYGINEYAADYESYAETEDYVLWSEYGDPAGLGVVTYQIER